MSQSRHPVPDFIVEQLLLGELPKAEAEAVRAQLRASDDKRLDALQASNAEILREHAPQSVARSIEGRLTAHNNRPSRRWPVWIGAAVSAAAAAALVAILRPADAPSELSVSNDMSPPDMVRIKGDAAVVLRRQHDGRTLSTGDTVSAGDVLQVSYRAGGWRYGVLVSVDGAGAVTLHAPASATDSTALQPTAVLSSFELDDAPDFELFLLFVDHAPLDVAEVLQHVQASRTRGTSFLPGPAQDVTELFLQRSPAR